MKTLITKNDIWRILGIILLVGGQFFHKENFSGFGVTMETNLVQIVGATLLLLPFGRNPLREVKIIILAS